MEDFDCDFGQECRILLQNIENISIPHNNTSESFDAFRSAFLENFTRNGEYIDVPYGEIYYSPMNKLAAHAHDASVRHEEYFEHLFDVLATATTSVHLWRIAFGSFKRRSADGHEAAIWSHPADCILEVARRATVHFFSVATTRNALKLIANCCADNNQNRELVIHRGGIEALLRIACDYRHLDLLIPTLYNVCADYDEPATSLNPIDQNVLDPGETNPSKGSQPDEVPPLSVEKLAAAYILYPDFTTFELLLSLQFGISDQLCSYLSELVQWATLPALSGFEHVHQPTSTDSGAWAWECCIKDKKYNTIELIFQLSQRDSECMSHVCRAVLDLLSQQSAIDALLAVKDVSIWTLLTLPCHDIGLSSDTEEDSVERSTADVERKAFLKLLYQITGDPRFSQNEDRAFALIDVCTRQLELYNSLGEQGHAERPQITIGDRQSVLLASACVVISQLAVSQKLRISLAENERLLSSLLPILSDGAGPDVIYPAIAIVSRLLLDLPLNLPPVYLDILSAMQNLLTAKGLGLTVPLEVVMTYRIAVKDRPMIFEYMLERREGSRSILDDVLTLWSLTVDAAIKLEVGKLCLDMLRIALSQNTNSSSHAGNLQNSPLTSFLEFLRTSAVQVAEIFAWICTKAEPPTQRDHGWFGLAMLSIWEEATLGICTLLERDHDFEEAILRASRLQDGAVPNNLKLMLSKLQASSCQRVLSQSKKTTLESAAKELGLPGLFE